MNNFDEIYIASKSRCSICLWENKIDASIRDNTGSRRINKAKGKSFYIKGKTKKGKIILECVYCRKQIFSISEEAIELYNKLSKDNN